ncbi:MULTISPECIES: class I SAM-dependent methyltransferase [unclassified Nocardia]|uniref:class I SAM-dependent methyltransferase n=1 Tax=unclassified Nocardia TaxID=2637762 RepID=UPI001CE4ADC9|nr:MULTISPECIES: class I SAM-dependent methyltransferase [unclassified Nocardia]
MDSTTGLDQAERDGAAAYSPRMLAIYDLRVLGFNCRFIWRCSTRHTLALYNRNMSADHLDIGTGTGWHLCHAIYPVEHPRVTLVDLNRNSLAETSRRLQRRGIDPVTRVGTVLQPLPVDGRRFQSISSTYLMHCVPGGWDSKGKAFQHIADVLADDGVFFGATVLNSGVPHNAFSRREMRRLRAHGIYHNESDDLDGLVAALGRAFDSVNVDTRGSAALWTASMPRRISDTGAAEPR